MGLIDVRRGDAMRSTTVGRARFPPRAERTTPRDAARKGRGLAMQRAPRLVEVVFEAVDFLPELVPLLPVAVPIPVRPLMLTAQPLNFAPLPVDLSLLAFELVDQLFTRRRAPGGSHASLMPRLDHEYKRKLRRSRRSDGGPERITR
jgi:hypothetical protein